MESYFGAYWKKGSLTLGEFIERLSGFVRQLQTLHPLLREWQLVGNRPGQKTEIESDLSNLSALSREHAWDRKAPKHWISNLDQDSRPSLNSTSEVGYRMYIENGSEEAKGVDRVSCRISAGTDSPWLKNSVVITTPDDSPLGEPDVAIQIIRLLVDFWHPDSAVATRSDFSELTYKPDDTGSIGWMTYFANPAISEVLPKDVIQRPFGDNGVLILTAPEMPRPGDAKAEDTAIRVADALRRAELTS